MIKSESVSMYKEVLQAFLKVTPFKDVLERQHKFVDSLVTLIRTVTKESGNRKKKIERLQQLLQVGYKGLLSEGMQSIVIV